MLQFSHESGRARLTDPPPRVVGERVHVVVGGDTLRVAQGSATIEATLSTCSAATRVAAAVRAARRAASQARRESPAAGRRRADASRSRPGVLVVPGEVVEDLVPRSLRADEHVSRRLEGWIVCEGLHGDVTVGFHTQHTHFGPWEEFSDQDARINGILRALDEAIATAHEFLAERMVVITWYRNGNLVTALRVRPEDASTTVRDVTTEIVELRWRLRRFLSGHRRGRVDVTIRSWAGTHDADFADVR